MVRVLSQTLQKNPSSLEVDRSKKQGFKVLFGVKNHMIYSLTSIIDS